MKRKKEELNKHLNPEKYKMSCCPYCNGTGRLSNVDKVVKVCSQCGGFGWVKKEEEHE